MPYAVESTTLIDYLEGAFEGFPDELRTAMEQSLMQMPNDALGPEFDRQYVRKLQDHQLGEVFSEQGHNEQVMLWAGNNHGHSVDVLLHTNNCRIAIEIEKAEKKRVVHDLLKLIKGAEVGAIDYGALIYPRTYRIPNDFFHAVREAVKFYLPTALMCAVQDWNPPAVPLRNILFLCFSDEDGGGEIQPAGGIAPRQRPPVVPPPQVPEAMIAQPIAEEEDRAPEAVIREEKAASHRSWRNLEVACCDLLGRDEPDLPAYSRNVRNSSRNAVRRICNRTDWTVTELLDWLRAEHG